MSIRISELTDAGALLGDELLEMSVPSLTVTMTATTISAHADSNGGHFSDSGSGFVSAGFAVGDSVRVSGFTELGNNVFSARITALISGVMTIGGDDGGAIVDEAAGDSVTVTKWETRRATVDDVAEVVGGAGTVTSVDASGGVETVSGSAITAAGTIRGSTLVNAQTGTSYTYVAGDRGKLVTHSNAASIAGSLPQATSTFGAGWFMRVKNNGAGTLTITPATSTIGGASTLVLTTGMSAFVVSDGADYQAAVSSSGGTLTSFAEAITTASPNATVPVASLTAVNAATNVDIALKPKGSGALQRDTADGTSTGGDKRGVYAVDWQGSRSSAAQAATGARSHIGGGYKNTASGTDSVVSGGEENTASGSNSAVPGGYRNEATGSYSFASGYQCTADGYCSTAFGYRANARGLNGVEVFSSATYATVGDFQTLRMNLGARTTNNTQTQLDSQAAGSVNSTNQMTLPNNSALVVKGLVVARQNTTGDTATWEFTAAIKRGASAATTAMVAACTPALIVADAGASAWTLAVDADTTNGCLRVRVTGETSKTILWQCSLTCAQTQG